MTDIKTALSTLAAGYPAHRETLETARDRIEELEAERIQVDDIMAQLDVAVERASAKDRRSKRLASELEAAHDTLDAICMAGHMHLVSAALPEGHGMDTFRAALGDTGKD